MKRTLSVLLAALMCMPVFTGCGKAGTEDIPTVSISLWGDERTIPYIKDCVESFKEQHADEVTIEYVISKEGEDTCKDTVLADPEGAADIFTFASDQLDELVSAGALLEITENADAVIEACGGKGSAAEQVSMRDGKLYTYPLAAGNGYFMYYNKAYFSESDVTDLDTMMQIAADNGKKISMDIANGWYLYSFFKAAGYELETNADKTANICDWNTSKGAHSGAEVAQAVLDIVANDGFAPLGDDGFVSGVESGEIIAGVNGAWNSEKIAAAWGDDYAAAKLPEYTVGGDKLQMCSFTGYKLLGINASTSSPEWCMKLAEYMTNEENQLKRFDLVGECPANIKAAQSEKVQAAPAVAALGAQSGFGYVQSVADPYWSASEKLGSILAVGDPDGIDPQELLDDLVAESVTPQQ